MLLVPGDFFDMDGYLRIGFGSDPAYLESALSLIGEFLSSVGAACALISPSSASATSAAGSRG